MKKNTHDLISRLPLGKAVLFALGQDKMLMCSSFMETEGYAKIMNFAKEHPDVVITRKLGTKILNGKVK